MPEVTPEQPDAECEDEGAVPGLSEWVEPLAEPPDEKRGGVDVAAHGVTVKLEEEQTEEHGQDGHGGERRAGERAGCKRALTGGTGGF